MIRKIRARLTYANVMATFAVFLGLTGTALASVIITSNSQVASGTISGHHPPSGKHSNIITGSVNGTDVQAGSIGSAQLSKGEANKPVLFFKNGWSNFGFGTAPASFYKDPVGVVHLRGTITGGTAGSPAFTLPAGYRPSKGLFMPAMGGGPEAALLQITTNGDVSPDCVSGACIIGMDGLSFRP
jgi:hypothetical protein